MDVGGQEVRVDAVFLILKIPWLELIEVASAAAPMAILMYARLRWRIVNLDPRGLCAHSAPRVTICDP